MIAQLSLRCAPHTRLRRLPDVDGTKRCIADVCQTGRQPLLISARRDYLSATLVLYGAILQRRRDVAASASEPIAKLLEQVSCPVAGIFGELDNLVPVPNALRMVNVLAQAKKSFDIRTCPMRRTVF